jgi:branched-chain amino acid transport system ATP-binding protein
VAEPILRVESLCMSFGGVHALRGVEFGAEPGTVTAIIGPNGAGKTTLINLISGFYTPDSGTIAFKGTDITGRAPEYIAWLGIARTFQNIRLFRTMRVLETVKLGCHARTKSGALAAVLRTKAQRVEEAEITSRAREALDLVGIGNTADLPAAKLSYGDQRRVEVARALASSPSLLMLDEPTAGMNSKETQAFGKLVSSLAKEHGLGILLISHDLRLVMRTAQNVLVLDHGEVIAYGKPEEVRADLRVQQSYIGRRGTKDDG